MVRHMSLVEQGLTSRPTGQSLGHFGDDVFTGQMTQPTVSKHWRRVVIYPDSSQSHQAHLTVRQLKTNPRWKSVTVIGTQAIILLSIRNNICKFLPG